MLPRARWKHWGEAQVPPSKTHQKYERGRQKVSWPKVEWLWDFRVLCCFLPPSRPHHNSLCTPLAERGRHQREHLSPHAGVGAVEATVHAPATPTRRRQLKKRLVLGAKASVRHVVGDVRSEHPIATSANHNIL